MSRRNRHTPYQHLSKKWVARHQKIQKSLWERHGKALEWAIQNSKHFAVGTLGGLMMLASPVVGVVSTAPSAHLPQPINKRVFIIDDLTKVVPKEVRPLTTKEEESIAEVLSRDYNLNVTAKLNGKRLNRSYGFIGAEQHLTLYPGDTIESHFTSDSDKNNFASAGMAPGLGAWGYFATSKDALTQKDILREKYYIAVQTFLIADYNQRVAEYSDFFKYRKILVVNSQTGDAVVAVIGDAGPAEWTGKQLGGSPEVMQKLERKDGKEVGPVLYFFIDDPNDTIPLGPITI